MELTDHTVLITGGSAGIGLAFARKFIELGNEVIVTGRRQSKLDEVKAMNPRLHTIQSDVADPTAIASLAAEVKRRFPKLDVLMNNAGVFITRNLRAPNGELAGLTEIEINLSGTIRMTSALIDLMTTNKGTIINVSSALAFVPLTAAPIYCATKAAIHSYTTSLRFQVRGAGVRVVELMPPLVNTEASAAFPEDGFKAITTDVLVAATVEALRAGALEIRVGQSNQLYWMSRIAPGFINRQLWKGSRALIPPLENKSFTSGMDDHDGLSHPLLAHNRLGGHQGQ
jgi:uncharacterized oxidoreductase